VATLRHFILPW